VIVGHFAIQAKPKGGAAPPFLGEFEARASVATGRMGFVLSLGFFLALAMSAWALLTSGIELAASGFAYCPVLFKYPAVQCAESLSAYPVIGTASYFLQDRFENSTAPFSLIAVLLLALVAYLLIVLFPSGLAELKVVKLDATLLGKWLTGGYRKLDRVVALITWIGVVLAVLVTCILALSWFGSREMLERFAVVTASTAQLSQQFLKPFVITAATATLALSAAGGLLSRYVPWLRAPLDAALDVDNHFREFPRTAIPRARIFSRFVALLEHVEREGYDDIVIVSHSQGTVIATELLRYLRERANHASVKPNDRAKVLWEKIERKISLMTAGSPLRQLYASRFPVLYDWVLAGATGPTMGPKAADVGAKRWVNAYATGDYIGRWIWTRPADGADVALGLIDLGPGSADVYGASDVNASDQSALMDGSTERDIGIGAGAHTHYFDGEQAAIAQAIDALSTRVSP